MMRWTYLLLMNTGAHMEMRVFQVVDNQQVSIIEFSGRRTGNLLTMTIVIEADESKATRIEALLWKLPLILGVDTFPTDSRQRF